MKIQFLGAAGTVTGSRYLLTYGRTTLLVDCGLYQGFKNLRLRNWAEFPVDPRKIDAVLLTHAHLDHSGYLPLLIKNGFRGAIYATRPTIDLCRILLPDSGYLQEEEARLANKKGFSKHHPALPLYTVDDATTALKYFKPVDWREPIEFRKKGHEPLEVTFHPAGHLLGAASIHVSSESTSIAFSGDLGRISDPLLRKANPQFAADYIVLESTYGDRLHPQTDPKKELQDAVVRTHKRNGILLIPSFAVGRAQLVLYYLLQLKRDGLIPDLPIYLNSPMAAKASKAFSDHVEELRLNPSELDELWKSVHFISSTEESKALNQNLSPSIIIAASGMATGGRVLHHLKSLVGDPKNTILFVGYQAGGTRGDLMVRGAQSVKIHGQHWPIRAEVMNLESLSAHADADELIAWVKSLHSSPKHIFVTHGEPTAADALRLRIWEELGIPADAPEHLQEQQLT